MNASVEGGVTDANHQTGTYIQWVVSPVGDTANATNVTGGLGGHSYDIASEAGIFMYYPTYVCDSRDFLDLIKLSFVMEM